MTTLKNIKLPVTCSCCGQIAGVADCQYDKKEGAIIYFHIDSQCRTCGGYIKYEIRDRIDRLQRELAMYYELKNHKKPDTHLEVQNKKYNEENRQKAERSKPDTNALRTVFGKNHQRFHHNTGVYGYECTNKKCMKIFMLEPKEKETQCPHCLTEMKITASKRINL